MGAYKIPREIKSDIKVTAFLTLKDIAIAVGVFFVLQMFKNSIHGSLIVPFYLVFGALAFFLLLPSIKNPKKRNYHTLYYVLKRDQNYYHPISRDALEMTQDEGGKEDGSI